MNTKTTYQFTLPSGEVITKTSTRKIRAACAVLEDGAWRIISTHGSYRHSRAAEYRYLLNNYQADQAQSLFASIVNQ